MSFSVCRWLVCASEVAALLALECSSSLHHPQLQPAPVGALVSDNLPDLHTLDSHVLLPHGLDGTKHSIASAHVHALMNTQMCTAYFLCVSV